MIMLRLLSLAFLIILGLVSEGSYAASISIPMILFQTDGTTTPIGSISAENSMCGVLLTPHLQGLSPGVHGFHIHEKASCEDKGMAAGGHLDPRKTNHHQGPYHQGHLGDLPILIVNHDGTATLPTLAPRFKLSQLKGHALIIHAGGDNYSDQPEKLGGGGARIACGVIS
jgi:Cu-Zn family superoxide dismutase